MHCRACRLVVPVVVALVTSVWAGCSVEDPGIPALTSPSGFGAAVTLSAFPDRLPRNGSAQSVVIVTVRDSTNTPAQGQRLTVTASVGTLSQDEIVTDVEGRASFAFVAPAATAVANEAQIQVAPISDGNERSLPRVLTIQLTGVSNTTVPPLRRPHRRRTRLCDSTGRRRRTRAPCVLTRAHTAGTSVTGPAVPGES